MKPIKSRGIILALILFIQLTFLWGIVSGQVCSNPESIIYGLNTDGLIQPITVSNASKGTAITSSTPSGTRDSPNGLGYNSQNGKFYFFWNNPSGGSTIFVSYDPTTGAYANLATSGGPNVAIRTGSVTNDGKYYCTDINGKLYAYNISANTWKLITDTLVDQDGNNVSVIIQEFNTGDIAFDGLGNLWFVTSGNGKIGLYKINATIPTNTISSLSITRILGTSTNTPDGNEAYGIAFSGDGKIYISTSNNLYLFNPSTLSFTLKGKLSNILDLTSCNFPMTVMPVRWIGLQVKANNKNQVFVNWQVSDEINNKGYHVEMSYDGQSWMDIGYVPSKAMNSNETAYDLTFMKKMTGLTYFRIKQLDIDGKFSYSWVKKLDMAAQEEPFIWPNPVSNAFNLMAKDSNVKIQIVNLGGKVAMTVPLKTGVNRVDVSDLAKGIYTVRYTMENGEIKMLRMIKQ